jgi:hypothetical protein
MDVPAAGRSSGRPVAISDIDCHPAILSAPASKMIAIPRIPDYGCRITGFLIPYRSAGGADMAAFLPVGSGC